MYMELIKELSIALSVLKGSIEGLEMWSCFLIFFDYLFHVL